jgi:hypothetical protein
VILTTPFFALSIFLAGVVVCGAMQLRGSVSSEWGRHGKLALD